MRNRFHDEEDLNYQDKDLVVRHIFGIGFDHHDGHKRMTTADQFSIIGGSEETHERLTETFLRTFDDLKRQGKLLEESSPEEIAEMIHKNSV